MTQNSQQSKALSRIEHILTGSPVVETILNIFKAVLSTTPLTGGISSLITDYIPSSRFLRLEQFAERVAKDLKDVAARVDAGYVNTDEFAFIFERSFRGAAENYQREKLDAFRGILVNAAVRNDVKQEEKEYFLVLVNNLSVLHLRILRFMAEPRAYLVELQIDERRVHGGFSDMFGQVIPGIDPKIIESAFGDLYQLGLLTTDKTIFHTMTSAQGMQLLGNRVAELGHRFVEFCRSPASAG